MLEFRVVLLWPGVKWLIAWIGLLEKSQVPSQTGLGSRRFELVLLLLLLNGHRHQASESRCASAPFANLSRRDGIQGRVGSLCMRGVSQGQIGHGRSVQRDAGYWMPGRFAILSVVFAGLVSTYENALCKPERVDALHDEVVAHSTTYIRARQ